MGSVVLRSVAGAVALAMLSCATALVSPAEAGTSRSAWAPTAAAELTPTARPLRAVPGYAAPDGFHARTRAGDGGTETDLGLPVGSGRLVWGDWWARGTQTPAVYRGGVWRLYGAGFGHPTVAATIRFGRKGDRPVVGDWNADGYTDLGVVRGATWRLAVRRTPAPEVWRAFTFGPRDGQPVAGDWDGVGPDGVAMFKAGRWWVKEKPGRSARVRQVSFAYEPDARKRAATAVAGDWDGDGRAGVALVRADRWRIAPRLGNKPKHVRVREIVRPAHATPVVWTAAGGPRGDFCPTATGRAGPKVTTSTPPGLQRPQAEGELPKPPGEPLVLEGLQRTERFLLGEHRRAPWSARAGQVFTDMLAGDARQEYALRRPAMAGLTIAVSVATGAHDETYTRTAVSAARGYLAQIVRSLACQHLAVSPGGWGHGWQTGHWAQLTALAAWLVWDDLSAWTRADVTAMLLDEADFQLTQPVEYWRDPGGDFLPGRHGNSAAEELAWDVALLELARSMFPDSPRAADYRRYAVQWAVASYARPSDLLDLHPVNGVAPALRLTGTNALEDGTVINHGRVEPDYMGNIQHLWWAADFALLAQTTTPEAIWHNARKVYGAFSTVSFTAGEPSAADNGRVYLPPGGTFYARDGEDRLYYPDGTAWGVLRRAPFVSVDAHASAYGLVPVDAWPAAAAEEAHSRGQLALSKSSGGSGRTYSADPSVAMTQDAYKGREEYAAQQLAMAWLAHYLSAWGPPPVDETFYGVPGEAYQRQPVAPPRPPSP